MKDKFVFTFVIGLFLTVASEANQTFIIPDAMNQMSHDNFYVWRIELDASTGDPITGGSISFYDLYNEGYRIDDYDQQSAMKEPAVFQPQCPGKYQARADKKRQVLRQVCITYDDSIHRQEINQQAQSLKHISE